MPDTSLSKSSKITLIDYYVFVALAYLAVFTPLFYFEIKSNLISLVHLFDFVTILAAYLLYRFAKYYSLLVKTLCLDAFLTVFVVTITGGYHLTGVYLSFAYIPFVLFLNPRKEGIVWVITLFLSLFLILPLSIFGIVKMPYTFIHYGLYLFTYLITVILLFTYVHAKDVSDKLVEEKTRQNAEINTKLSNEFKEKDRLSVDLQKRSKELETRTKDLEAMNKMMVGRELKMAELKKEMEELKATLTKPS